MRNPFSVVATIAAGLLLSTGALACTPVTSIPATLSHGVYCLTGDVDTRGQVPFTLGENATLDCQGHVIRDASRNTAYAVVSGADNIEVRNCTFDGFYTTVELVGANHFGIVDNTFLAPMYGGIYMSGDDGLVSGNGFFYESVPMPGHPAEWDGAPSTAIIAYGGGTFDIVHNTISGAPSDGSGWTDRTGIYPVAGLVAYNVIRGLVQGNGHYRAGIEGHGFSVLYRNTLAVPSVVADPSMDYGLNCDRAASVQNVVVGFTSAGLGCDDIFPQVGLRPRDRRGAAPEGGAYFHRP
jgi:hypothetical protein